MPSTPAPGRSPVPQPSAERMVPPLGRPLVVGIAPGQDELVVRTAAAWANALNAELYCAYADPARLTVAELPGGHVQHAPVDPDGADDDWQRARDQLQARMAGLLGPAGVPWHLRYLAGRADRALTHLARAVDAAAIVVGSRSPGAGARLREAVGGSLAVHLAAHQHRPVLVVPVHVIDWREHP